MIFDYLIACVDQKLEDIEFVEDGAFCKFDKTTFFYDFSWKNSILMKYQKNVDHSMFKLDMWSRNQKII